VAVFYLLIERKAPCTVVHPNLCVRGAAWKAPGALADTTLMAS
jgi:hypothetical protein